MYSNDFFLSFFLYLFLCQQHYEKTAGPICMKFSGNVWSYHGTTFNFESIRVNGSAGRRSSCLSPAIAQTTGVNKSVAYVAAAGGVVVPHTTACFLFCFLFVFCRVSSVRIRNKYNISYKCLNE